MINLILPIVSIVLSVSTTVFILYRIGKIAAAFQTDPMVKKAMTILGKQGGDRKSVNAIKGKLAKGYIDNNLGLLKIVAEKVVGIDVDSLLEEYGAENILQAVSEIGPRLGLNPENLLKGLNTGSNQQFNNPYLKTE